MKKKLENFWYHYKWMTIVIAFFVTVAIIGIVQIATRVEYDVQIIYAGPAVIGVDGGSDDLIASAFESLLTEDRDGDGEINVLINAKTVLSDEQLAEKQAEAAKEHDHVAYDVSIRQEYLTEISTLMRTGQVYIFLFDPSVYGTYPAEDFFVLLSDITDEVPESAVDGYAVRLKDTDFGKKPAFSSLPDDTLICLHLPVSQKDSVVESYEYSRELFLSVLNYRSGS